MAVVTERLGILALAFAPSFLVSGCVEGPSFSSDVFDEGTLVPYTLIEKGSNTGLDYADRTERLLLNEQDWNQFWNQHTRHETPKRPTPAVNFTTHFVVAVVHGEQPTGGHSILIDAIFYDSESYGITYTASHPGDDCAVSQALTNPFHFVKAARRDAGDPMAGFLPQEHEAEPC